MNHSHQTTDNIALTTWIWLQPEEAGITASHKHLKNTLTKVDLLQPIRHWLDGIEIRNRKLAHQICKLIPTNCPFERDLKLFGRPLLHIPPLCKLNPLYDQVVALRFRALCYLADECGEDVTIYC